MVLMAANLTRPVWIASGSVTNGVRVFAAPVDYHLNVRGTTTALDIMAFGPSHIDYQRAVAANDYVAAIHPLDRVWLDRTPSDPTDTLAKDADYQVSTIQRGVDVATLMFRRLSNDA
jgi:hypothetical protein